jgi:chaperone required for assembly of F1-ATPase
MNEITLNNNNGLQAPVSDNAVIRRFYDAANVIEEKDDTFSIELSGERLKKPVFVKSQEHEKLFIPTKAIADKIAEEWQEQKENIDFNTMPITRIAITAMDYVITGRDDILNKMYSYMETDSICYRSDRHPKLTVIQQKELNPIIEWMKEKFDVHMMVTKGIMPIPQFPDSIDNLKNILQGYDNHKLTIAYLAASTCSSVVLAIALLEKRINAKEAFDLSNLDETFNMENWGMDPIIIKRRKEIQADINSYVEFLELLEE